MKATLIIRHHAGTLTLETEAGAPVAPLLREAGLLHLPCGVGKCGKCLIYADTEPCAEERALLGERIASGLRLACHTRATDGLEIRIPRPEALRVLTSFAQSGYAFRPIVERRAFAVEAPSLDDQRSDLQRLMDACAVDRHALDLDALAALPAFLRAQAEERSGETPASDAAHSPRDYAELCVSEEGMQEASAPESGPESGLESARGIKDASSSEVKENQDVKRISSSEEEGKNLAAPESESGREQEASAPECGPESGLEAAPESGRTAKEAASCDDGRIRAFGLVHGHELVGYTASARPHALIVDIGTTTVAALLVDLRSREVVAVRGEHNAQSSYGADVISRIRHETEWRESGAHGSNPLRAAIVGQIAALLRGLLDEAGIADVDALSITGNTTMMHLFCGLPAEGIGKAPFIPASLAPLRLPAAALGLPSRGTAFLMPGISSYIGADIVASLLAAEAHRDQPPFLLVDLGTNAETVLGVGGKLYACSAAAGPCFEGATLSCGMAGQEGAIDAVFPDSQRGLSFTTIGDAPARGLCGSGVLDAVALLLDAGALDETGRLEAEGPLGAHIRDDALVLADGVRLTQRDIREVQLAKAAVRAGIDVLLEEAGLAASDVACLYLAGGFGSAIRPGSAARIGLIPPELAGRVRVLGNAAGCGALRYVTEEGADESSLSIIRRTRYVELSAHPGFTTAYVDRMCFPETGEDGVDNRL